MKSGFIDKLIDRLDKVDPSEVQRYVLKIVQEKGFLENVFDVLQEGIIVSGLHGTIHYINRTACEFFGLDRDDTIGKKVSEQFPGIKWEDSVDSGRVVNRDLEVFYPEHRFLNFYIAPLTESGGKNQPELDETGGYVLILRDRTETRQLQQEEIESERISALTMLAAGVAHEIGNPLNSLTIHLQLIQKKLTQKADPELVAELSGPLEVAQSEIKRLDSIVKQFLSAIRPSDPQWESSDLNEILREAVNFLGPEIQDRRINIILQLHPNLPKLRLDPRQFTQVFYNLIRNSAQAIGSDGELIISTDTNDETVVLSFADNGAGVPADKVGKVFDPYFTTKKTGSGLGLLVVHRIVREHGGEIEFESKAGEGTKVSIYLPRIEKRMRFLPQKSEASFIDVDVDVDGTN